MLFDDVVAGRPGEVEPVAALPLHLAHLGRLLDDPQVALVPVALAADDLADRPLVEAVHELEVALLVAALGPGHDAQAFLGRQFRAGDDRADADRVDGHGLLHEDVLARLDGGLEVEGPEARRRGRDDVVDVLDLEQLLVAVEAGEAGLRFDLDRGRDLLHERLERALDAVLERVVEGHDLDARRGVNRVDRRARAAAAGPDDADANRVRAGGEEPARARERRRESRHGGGRGRPDEIPARQSVIVFLVHVVPPSEIVGVAIGCEKGLLAFEPGLALAVLACRARLCTPCRGCA
ncbi:MAG: hypothetical protein MZV64_14475 [Ignavibacteriales bacterium]|nr:hypothetical protein [Ignavibacteriales bacterium]